MITSQELAKLAQLIRYDIITSSTAAGSGHPTSSLSAVELLTTLFFGDFFRYNFEDPKYVLNDRVVFSKGHASPLFYSLYHVAGVVSQEELLTFRKIDSNLEGHPTPLFKYTEAATGSLGQGLSVGTGLALGARLKLKSLQLPPGTREPHMFVLLGDSEVAEGQVWEAAQIASHYKLSNMVALLDVNRLGQRGETMPGWDIQTYEKRFNSFGWNTIVLQDGHDIEKIKAALERATLKKQPDEMNALAPVDSSKPTIIIAKTVKGKGVTFLENKDDWHGKPVPKDMLDQAIRDIGAVDNNLRGTVTKPPQIVSSATPPRSFMQPMNIPAYDKPAATREAYGDALVLLGQQNQNIVVLDAEVSNSTFADKFAKAFPDRYFEMYIAEQNMVSVAAGLSRMGFVPFVSSFAAFLTRAFDQIRMAQYSDANLKVVGSHAGVSIGYDGSSQMGLEDLAMMRSLLSSVVLYPSDAISSVKLAEQALKRQGIVYIRTTREKTQNLYKSTDDFEIGKSKVLKESESDKAVIVSAGITLHEALKAYETLKSQGINVAVIDTYSVKPIDKDTLVKHAKTGKVIVVEDHYPYGGLGDAVREALVGIQVRILHLPVRQIPHSGSPAELLAMEEIDADAIVDAVKKI